MKTSILYPEKDGVHGKTKEVLTGSSGTGCSACVRSPAPARLAMGRDSVGGLFEAVVVSVTGTAIEAPSINMPHAVTVVSRETLEQQGATRLVDLFKNLSVSHDSSVIVPNVRVSRVSGVMMCTTTLVLCATRPRRRNAPVPPPRSYGSPFQAWPKRRAVIRINESVPPCPSLSRATIMVYYALDK